MSNKKKVYLIAYKDSPNIGDNFQTLTTKKILEDLGYEIGYVDRDRKDTSAPKVILINGYYSPKTIKTLNFDFHEDSKVLFYNIHIAVDNGRISYVKDKFLSDKKIYSIFKKYEPIGCRDSSTKDILNGFGIDAINNECITLLMEKRTQEQAKNADKVLLVDIDEFVPIPQNLKKNIEYRSQIIPGGEKLTNEEKLEMSREILDYYKNNAKLVVTSRFHCAMPCIAMGIPVIFFGDSRSKRCEGLKKYIQYIDYIHIGRKNVTHLKKCPRSDSIPFLNRKIKYDFNIIDVCYNLIYKAYLHMLYMFGVIKIDWNISAIDTEEAKKVKIDMLSKKLSNLFK